MNSDAQKPTEGSLAAIDVQGIPLNALSWERMRDGISPDDVPTCVVDDPALHADKAAALTWRWDRHPRTGRSRNLALALKYAQEQGIEYLFVDCVSIDQTLPRELLLAAVAGLANLYASIPAIAAYDEEHTAMSDWTRTLRRPWILSEIRAFSRNPTRVTYVGYRYGSKEQRSLSFANAVSALRDGGYADCVLEILFGTVGMTDIADFAAILLEFNEPVSQCYTELTRADYLLAVFLLTAKHERNQLVSRDGHVVNYGFRTHYGDISGDSIFDTAGLKRFALGPRFDEGRPFESARALLLDGHRVAICRTKMTSSYDRNWVEVLPEGEEQIFRAVNLSDEARDAYRQRPEARSASLRIEKNLPRPSLSEHAASFDRQCWLEEIPHPRGSTMNFDPDLWR